MVRAPRARGRSHERCRGLAARTRSGDSTCTTSGSRAVRVVHEHRARSAQRPRARHAWRPRSWGHSPLLRACGTALGWVPTDTALARVLRAALGEGRVTRWNHAEVDKVRSAVRGGQAVIVEVFSGVGPDGRPRSHAVQVEKALNSPSGTVFGVRDPEGGRALWVPQRDLEGAMTGQAVGVSAPQ